MPRAIKPAVVDDMNKRITVQERIETDTETGDIEETWNAVATCWAAVKPLRGREFWQAQQVQSEVTHKVTTRWVDGVTTDHRILFRRRGGGKLRIFNIMSVINVEEDNVILEMLCKESV